MSIAGLLFGSGGRINRARYWLALVIQLAVFAGIFAMVGTADDLRQVPIVMLLTAGALFLAAIKSAFAVATRRLHDRDKSEKWVAVFVLLPVLLLIASRKAADPQTEVAALSIACALLAWSVVELGVLRGTPGPNQYGADPLEKV